MSATGRALAGQARHDLGAGIPKEPSAHCVDPAPIQTARNTITPEQMADAVARGLTQERWAKERHCTVEKLKHDLRRSGLKWIAAPMAPPKTCNKGHSRAKHWGWHSGRMRCGECYRLRSEKWRMDAKIRASSMAIVAESFTWIDWMEAANREDRENHPHWVPRRSDHIKAWLVARGIKP